MEVGLASHDEAQPFFLLTGDLHEKSNAWTIPAVRLVHG